jgi:hypothetical protein
MIDNIESKPARRDFLRGVAIGALLVAGTVGVPKRALAKLETRAERTKSRYQEGAHIKRYYETNRY